MRQGRLLARPLRGARRPATHRRRRRRHSRSCHCRVLGRACVLGAVLVAAARALEAAACQKQRSGVSKAGRRSRGGPGACQSDVRHARCTSERTGPEAREATAPMQVRHKCAPWRPTQLATPAAALQSSLRLCAAAAWSPRGAQATHLPLPLVGSLRLWPAPLALVRLPAAAQAAQGDTPPGAAAAALPQQRRRRRRSPAS